MNSEISGWAAHMGGSYNSDTGTVTIPTTNTSPIATETDSTAGMLTFDEAYNEGLGPKSGDYTEALGSAKIGYSGDPYVLMLYTPTGRKHWYKKSFV